MKRRHFVPFRGHELEWKMPELLRRYRSSVTPFFAD